MWMIRNRNYKLELLSWINIVIEYFYLNVIGKWVENLDEII